MQPKRFVLLDRDGTVIVERNYLSDPAQVELLPNAAAGLRQMQDMGLGLVIITNQSGIGRGYFDETRLTAIHNRMTELLQAEGVRLDGIYFCPHTPEENCPCRKPKPGMVTSAAAELGFDPAASVMIGDKTADIEVGQRVGATTILVKTGYGAQEAVTMSLTPDYLADDLFAAAAIIRRLIL